MWSEASVIFVPKPSKDDYIHPNAYRPITLAKTIVKGLERVVYWHIESWKLKVQLINQFVFQREKSTDSAIGKVVDKVESAVFNNKNHAIIVFFNIERAFDNLHYSAMEKSVENNDIAPCTIK
ncbi:unnamed protein product [Lepeophtheirus salmonis]|uniref:(salmon louse) hypothetical protein n=1 Tax=Lepeophtheirus salmonis TaxID=72036 RepID=A0A7R8CKX9_LEPSM|nr:unnamed protein product [Lepeophtheirus salmonis]CAF2849067.1 unnamed protein product [Lepeophtheirus salmonis]